MADLLAVPETGPGGRLTRLRSSSSPSAKFNDDKVQISARPARPSHTRSHSYIHPANTKPTSAATFPPPDKPAESSRFSRLHLPGRHHHHSKHDEETRTVPRLPGTKHRYTQSETQQYHKKRDSALLNNEMLVTPVTTSASSTSEYPNDLLYPSSRGAAIPSLQRMTSTRSHRTNAAGDKQLYSNQGTDPRPGIRRRATSDPRSPSYDNSQAQLRAAHKTPIELQLERADHLRHIVHETVTEADIKRKDDQLKAASDELHDRLVTTTRSASDLMRRLDDAQETLLRTTESLVDTISSFSNLSDQSSKLITNFEHESANLDREIRGRITQFRNAICVKRGRRVDELEKRGRAANVKAEELGRRLENCRTIVKNWEQREANKRRTWRGIWVGVLWGVVLIAVAVFVGIASFKAAEIKRGGGTAAARLHHLIVHNRSQNVVVLEELKVPDSVREILVDIDSRVRSGKVFHQPVSADVSNGVGRAEKVEKVRDKGMRLLDEL